MDNSVCTTTWVSDAMDTACDLLDAEDAAEVTPLREALGLLLYSRAVRFAEEQAPVEQIDKLLSAITKLEKLKAAATSAPRTFNRETPREISPPTTRHIVELSVTPAPSSAPAKIVSVTAQSVRDPAENSPEPPKR